MLLSAIGLFNE